MSINYSLFRIIALNHLESTFKTQKLDISIYKYYGINPSFTY